MTFKPDQVYCVLDYETFSEAPLKTVGAFEYSAHPSTRILCAAWRTGTRETLPTADTMLWCPGSFKGEAHFSKLIGAFLNHDMVFVAHNAYFEQVITRNIFIKKHMYSMVEKLNHVLDPARWLCTASLASAMAIPRALAGAGEVMKLNIQKDQAGHRLMLKLSQPRKPTKNNPKTRHTDPQELKRLYEYCVTDINAEVELFLTLPPLNETERKVWVLDQTINLRGFQVDRKTVQTIQTMVAEEIEALNKETKELTFGAVSSTTEVAAVGRWLESQGLFLEDLTAPTVESALQTGLATGDARRMLEIRQAVAKTSISKFSAFEKRSRFDGRLRDNLIYHGASPGRWAGSGIQPQNFPKGSIKDSVSAIDKVISKGDLEMVRLIYGEPMNAFSSCLRGMIIAPQGKTLDVGDYGQIEARGVFWLANHEVGLQAYRDGRPMYEELAAEIYGVPLAGVTQEMRFVGKQATLGSGYGMGPVKFRATCQAFGQDVSDDLAERAIKTYRNVHHPVVTLWSNIEKASIAAVQNPGKRYSINHTTWFLRDRFLYCELPSGRRLAYADPTVRYEARWRGSEKAPVLYHWGVDSKTKKWVESGTYGGRLTENCCQAVARDIMAEAMLRIESAGWELVLSVHDELVAERDTFNGKTHEEFLSLMKVVPAWAQGFPIAVAGYSGSRYKK